MSRKHQILAEVAALEATLPQPGPCAHLPYVDGPEDLGGLVGSGKPFVLGPNYSKPLRVRKSLADIAELEG